MKQLFYIQSSNGRITNISSTPHANWRPVFVNQDHTTIMDNYNQYSIDKGYNVNYPNENKINLHLPNIVQMIKNNSNGISNLTFNDLKPKDKRPVNLAPYFWVESTHNDPYTFTVPVQKGKVYWLSGYIAQNKDDAMPIRAFSSWSVVDNWGDLAPNDDGTNYGLYKVGFIAPKTGNMPIYFNYVNNGEAIKYSPIFAIRNITVTQSNNYIPYDDTNNNNQVIKDVNGDNNGQDAIAKFGSKVLKGYKDKPIIPQIKNPVKADTTPINIVNIFPNYWVDSSHNDYYTFNVPVQQGHHYFLSAVVSNDPSRVPIRASSSWNIADEWGDIIEGDQGTGGVGNLYEIEFTAPKTGNMPIEFMFTSVAKAMQNGGASLMLKHITMTDGNIYVPYMLADNDNQSVADVTGDAGMDGVAMFGANDVHGDQNNPIYSKKKPAVINSNLNIFPNYWVDASHNDPYTFNVPVKAGHTYQLSAMIANDPSNVPLRASSNWNIADEWGDIVSNDGGTKGVGNTYHISFTAPQTGSMPIEFIFTSVAKAIQAGNAGMMLRRITMTDSHKYIPYNKCDNSKQSVADVTGDAGMDGRAMFGNL